MKLPDALNQFLHKTPEREEAYLSLVLQAGAVQAAVWTLASGSKPRIGEAATERVESNLSGGLEAGSWDKRLEACDRAIAKIAEMGGRDDFEKVVLGLPAYYLTHEDDISEDCRGHIKTLTSELELTPIGFVPIHQAVVHQIKEEEGVPPSVILLEVGPGKTAVIVYKVGAIVAREHIANDDVVPELERTLKGLKELEVLPSRVLLYGSDEAAIEAYKRDLLKHPWPTRANFLHYPKIEMLPTLSLAGAVSLAGASELASQMGEEKAAIATQATQAGKAEGMRVPQKEQPDETGDHTLDSRVRGNDTFDEGSVVEETVESEMAEEVDQNVVEVPPETLGFRRDVDILEKPVVAKPRAAVEEEPEVVEEPAGKQDLKETLARFISGVKLPRPPSVGVPKVAIVVFVFFVLLVVAGGWLSYWVLPKASVTILEVPQVLSESSSITVNPTATVVDPASKTVPGRKQEKTVSGEKTIAVSGQKDIGDPARGTVTVYNKTLTGKIFKKGAVLKSGSLSFTLDADVTVLAATITGTLGTETKIFGKTPVSITAMALGPQSNLPANKEFSIQGVSTEDAVANNDAALSGGTSKVVTVVSRADQEALVEALTRELIDKAKGELEASVGGAERLIDETIKTTLANKKFDQELDQESKELHGSITVTITGISYSENDTASLFADLVAAKVPSGYTLREGGAHVKASHVKVQKDGSITLTIEYQGQALPMFDTAAIGSRLAGKTFAQAQEDIKAVSGVGGVEFGSVLWSLWGRDTFPANASNITVSTAVLE